MPPTAQKRNASMQALNGVDMLHIDNKNFAAEYYDGPGGQTFTSAVTVNLDTEKLNAAPTVFSLTADIITLLEAGLYLFNFCATASHSSGSSNATIAVWLEEDPATGSFAIIPGTICYAVINTVGFVTAVNSSIIRAGIDYRYRLQIARTSGSDTMITVANQSKVSILRLFKNG